MTKNKFRDKSTFVSQNSPLLLNNIIITYYYLFLELYNNIFFIIPHFLQSYYLKNFAQLISHFW